MVWLKLKAHCLCFLQIADFTSRGSRSLLDSLNTAPSLRPCNPPACSAQGPGRYFARICAAARCCCALLLRAACIQTRSLFCSGLRCIALAPQPTATSARRLCKKWLTRPAKESCNHIDRPTKNSRKK